MESNKHIVKIVVNFILAIVSVFLFEYWFKHLLHSNLTTLQQAANIGAVIMVFLTYFVANSFYTKGVLNNLKKIVTTLIMAAIVLGLMALSVKDIHDIIYPASGVIIASIAFYMLSLSTGTLGAVGIIALIIILLAPIMFGVMFKYITMHTAVILIKVSLFLILFVGGTWAEIRFLIHGIRGTNRDSGNFGDENDGDGDTGSE